MTYFSPSHFPEICVHDFQHMLISFINERLANLHASLLRLCLMEWTTKCGAGLNRPIFCHIFICTALSHSLINTKTNHRLLAWILTALEKEKSKLEQAILTIK